MLDRLVQAAARAAGVSSMVLGLRYADQYEFISTFGVPLTAYTDRVPGKMLHPKLFMREIEVEDLQSERDFTALTIAEIAKSWRYGCNVPVPLVHPLSDNGVLALSGADLKVRKLGGSALKELRRIADIIGDSVWLIQQIELAAARRNAVETVSRILVDGIRTSRVPAALVNEDLTIIGFSENFSLAQMKHLELAPAVGQNIAEQWLDAAAKEAVRSSVQSMQPVVAAQIERPDGQDPVRYDFHTLQFDGVPTKFGIFGIHVRNAISTTPFGDFAAIEPSVHSAVGDGLGPVSRFLSDTLLKKRRLLRSKAQSYLALRSWAKPIRNYQIAALKALKADCPDSFVRSIADEMAQEISQLFGSVSDHVVVGVPCGHSGPGCLSDRLAIALAEKLGIECEKPFDCQTLAGCSHPKQNVKRPKMRIAKDVRAPVILVDDVVTTGSHIEEAGRLLNKSAPSVWAITWIAH